LAHLKWLHRIQCGFNLLVCLFQPNELNKKVTFLDQDHTVGRQLVPGVILMPGSDMGAGLNRAPGGLRQMGDGVSPRTTAVIAKELLDKGNHVE
jgi:hypothetical protein